MKPIPITETSFETFHSLQGWTVYDIPQCYWGKMDFLPRKDDVVAVLASGCQTTSREMHNFLVQAGMDVVVFEPNPKPTSKYGPEPDINVYHLVFQKLKSSASPYSYLAYGPFNFGALVPHWPKPPEEAVAFYCQVGKNLGEIPRKIQVT